MEDNLRLVLIVLGVAALLYVGFVVVYLFYAGRASSNTEPRCPARKDLFWRCERKEGHRGSHQVVGDRRSRDYIIWSGGKQCQVCRGKDFVVVAEGGGGENVRCEKCGSLYTWSLFGLELIQAGQPSAKVVLPANMGEAIICNSNQEAFDVAKAWNRTHDVNPAGAYVIDDGGVVATDGRYPIR